jgi:phage shock protein E
MNWTAIAIVAVIVVAFLLFKRATLVSESAAREYLKQGAKVLDVRSPEEFRERHLPGAINLPLGEVTNRIQAVVPDKGQPVLLHCLSGGRSGMAQHKLRRMGYRNAFNLGGYSRAARIAGENR